MPFNNSRQFAPSVLDSYYTRAAELGRYKS